MLAPVVPLRPFRLPSLPFLRLRFALRARERALLPAFKGSMLRGAFGHALRRAACAVGPRGECASCPLRAPCPVPRLLDTRPQDLDGPPPPFSAGLPTAPRPYVFEPAGERREFSPGDPLGFDLLLLGRAAELAPYARLAVERMAEAGLGSRRARFALETVAEAQAGATPTLAAPHGTLRAATLHFATPLRIKAGHRLETAPSPRRLAFLMLRRLGELAAFHAPDAAVDWGFRPLLEAAGRLRVARADLAWHDQPRYSDRQGTAMLLGGLVGSMRLEGDLAPLAPLLAAAEIVHVGKGTTFGLGQVRVEWGGTGTGRRMLTPLSEKPGSMTTEPPEGSRRRRA